MHKTILITGGVRRIGRILSLHFAKEGWHVAAHYSGSQDDAVSLKNEVEQSGGKLSLFQTDFTSHGAADALFERVNELCGTPYALINNAARFERDDGGITEESLSTHMAANTATPIRLCQHMRTAAPQAQFIFNILDRTLDCSWPYLPAYVLSKHAFEEWINYQAPLYRPHIHMFGLRLGPTLRNPRESEKHFDDAIAAYGRTEPQAIIDAITKLLQQPIVENPVMDI